MKAVLTQLAARSWDELHAEPVDRWLWVDSTAPGVHLQEALPETPPLVTHLWGWGAGFAIRARIDQDLATADAMAGVRGARLTWAGEPPAAEAIASTTVIVTEAIAPVWSVTHGAASMPEVPGLATAAGRRDLVTLTVHRTIESDGETSFAPLTFVGD